MPHKHTRKHTQRAEHDYDLAPTARAAPLPVHPARATSKSTSAGPGRTNKKRKRKADDDDTPAEFKRLMRKSAAVSSRASAQPSTTAAKSAAPRSVPSASSKKQAATSTTTTSTTTSSATDPPPTPQPRPSGLSDPSFSTRGPLPASLATSLKPKSTRLQRKIERKVAAIKTDAARQLDRRREAMARAREENEARLVGLLERSGVRAGDADVEALLGRGMDDEHVDQGRDAGPAGRRAGAGEGVRDGKGRTGRKKGKRDEDDWAVLKERREKPRGLHDVAQAPPELKKVRKVFKDRTTGQIGGVVGDAAGGGLKHEADLSEARMEVIRRYREMMGRDKDGGL